MSGDPTWKAAVERVAERIRTLAKGPLECECAARMRAYAEMGPYRASCGIAAFIAGEVAGQMAVARRPMPEHLELVELAAQAFLAAREADRAEKAIN